MRSKHPLAVTGQALLHLPPPSGSQACLGFAMDDLRSVDPAFVPADFAAAFGPNPSMGDAAAFTWRGLWKRSACWAR